ncbi:hypothetical protein CH252_30480 [Rhodococcus sp. 06-1477-1B]|nr:hypothetical protein CH252_30480 [Rhodococcus sp. 06-1477-1B]
MTRRPLLYAEENNVLGSGSLTDGEVRSFAAAVEQLRAAITEVDGSRWDDQMYAGQGYVVTETLSRTGYFVGYRGVRRTVHGYAAITADERIQETGRATFGRFEDAVKAYLAAVVESLLLPSRTNCRCPPQTSLPPSSARRVHLVLAGMTDTTSGPVELTVAGRECADSASYLGRAGFRHCHRAHAARRLPASSPADTCDRPPDSWWVPYYEASWATKSAYDRATRSGPAKRRPRRFL